MWWSDLSERASAIPGRFSTALAMRRALGLARHHEFEEFEEFEEFGEPTSLFLANQAVAFARMSRSILSWRFSRRSRLSSSRSALLSPSLPGRGLPASRAD